MGMHKREGGREAVRQNRVRVCNGSFLLVFDISSIQGIILRAVLYTMHSVNGISNHLTSRPLPFKLFDHIFLVFLIPQRDKSVSFDNARQHNLQASAFPGTTPERPLVSLSNL